MKKLAGKLLALAAFVAVVVWFVTLIPAALDAECRVQDLKVARHFEMLRDGGAHD